MLNSTNIDQAETWEIDRELTEVTQSIDLIREELKDLNSWSSFPEDKARAEADLARCLIRKGFLRAELAKRKPTSTFT